MHGKRYTEGWARVATKSPGDPEQFSPHVGFHRKLVGILALLGVRGAVAGGMLASCISGLSCQNPPDLPKPATRWKCVNLLLVPADQQPAISQASRSCACSIETFLWCHCLSLQTMEGNQEPV